MRAMTVGLGGAPATVTTSSRSRRCASGASAIVASTVGAPLRWVIPSSLSSRQITSARTSRRQTWVPATAASAQPVHQPLQ